MRGDLFPEFDGSCIFGKVFIPLFCGTRTPREEKKHMSSFQIHACNYLSSLTQIVNIDSEITQRLLELLENLNIIREKIKFSKLRKTASFQNKVVH